MNQRKIKFRAWIQDCNDKWEMTYDLAFEDYAPINDLLNSVEHLMQWTGLKDKNNIDIYEGDIIEIAIWKDYGFGGKHSTTIKATIEFQSGCFWFTGEKYTDCNWHFYNQSERKIIGNIYETKPQTTNQ